jgi:hypothetical protein
VTTVKCCSKETHDAIKRDDARWALQPIGSNGRYQPTYNDEPGSAPWLEMRDCADCEASMSREVMEREDRGESFGEEEPTKPIALFTVDGMRVYTREQMDARWAGEVRP